MNQKDHRTGGLPFPEGMSAGVASAMAKQYPS